MPEAFARPLIDRRKAAKGGVNVSPELSPDGTKIVFFSSRDFFSIDLDVADATTGKSHQQDHRHRHQPPPRQYRIHRIRRRVVA